MTDNRPNVLLFTTDQHRGDFLGIAGHPLLETPNFDGLVDHGAYFPNANTEIPSTTGARRILLSGKGSYDCGLTGYAAAQWDEPNTLAHVLARSGYHCLNVGFRNLHPRRKLFGFHHVKPHDLRQGEDDYMTWLKDQAGPLVSEFGHGVDPNGWTARPWHLPEHLHSTNWTTETAIDMLRRRDPTKPFFMWCSHLRPHSPYDPPQPYWDMYDRMDLPETPVGDWADRYDIPNPGLHKNAWKGRLTPEQIRRGKVGYMGTVTHLDDSFGRFLEALGRELGVASNTLIIVTADHGDMLGDHHLHRKTYAYEGSARIPFLIGYPWTVDKPSGTFDQVVGLQDVLPTVLDSVGVDIPEGVTGRSVFDAISGKQTREFLHGEHSPCYDAEPAMQYLTDGKEKYIYFPTNGSEEFFDLTQNRDELKDLSGDTSKADRLAMWRQRLICRLAQRDDGFSDGTQLLKKESWGPIVDPKNEPYIK